MDYRHTQIGWLIIALIAGGAVALLIFGGNGALSRPNREIAAAVLAVSLLLFYSLTVQVKDGILSCGFGLGLIRRKIPLADIMAVRSVRNPWYAGWGIRWLPGEYLLWNVSGTQAVEIDLKNGTRFRIGTDQPEALVEAIQSHKIH